MTADVRPAPSRTLLVSVLGVVALLLGVALDGAAFGFAYEANWRTDAPPSVPGALLFFASAVVLVIGIRLVLRSRTVTLVVAAVAFLFGVLAQVRPASAGWFLRYLDDLFPSLATQLVLFALAGTSLAVGISLFFAAAFRLPRRRLWVGIPGVLLSGLLGFGLVGSGNELVGQLALDQHHDQPLTWMIALLFALVTALMGRAWPMGLIIVGALFVLAESFLALSPPFIEERAWTIFNMVAGQGLLHAVGVIMAGIGAAALGGRTPARRPASVGA